jgi:hypothetical protein
MTVNDRIRGFPLNGALRTSKRVRDMKYIVLAAVTALVAGAATVAHAANPPVPVVVNTPVVSTPIVSTPIVSTPIVSTPIVSTDAGSLSTLLAEWDQAAFNPPGKPSQYRVFGRNGYVTSGPEYNAMVALIRSAVADAAAGHGRAETLDIARARGLLAGVAPAAAVSQINGKV